MKLKVLFFILFSIAASTALLAQRQGGDGSRPPSREAIERLRAMKVAMITEKISLTEDQAKGFWPIYNRYDGERRKLNQNLREQMRKNSPGSEETELARQDAIFELREQEVELSKRYRPEFLKVISASQYSDLLIAEKEFSQMLLKELRDRRSSGGN